MMNTHLLLLRRRCSRYSRRAAAALFFGLALTLTFAASPAAHADAVDDVVNAEMKRRDIPAVSLVIYKGDRLVKKAAYGVADLELGTPTKPEHRFETGSIGKTLTATLAMLLVEEGKWALDDPVKKHFPDAPATWDKITLRHLLSHTSGLPDYALVPGLGLVERWTPDDWTKKIVTLPLDFETGTAFAYSNTNYYLLGLLLARVAGKPYEALLAERVLKPAGMNDTIPMSNREIIPGRAKGYWRLQDGQLVNAPEMVEGGADGGLVGTADDLAAFERSFRTGKLVKPAAAKEMQASQRLPDKRGSGYGYGWFVRDLYGHPWLSHGGNTAGFAASVSRFPDQDLTVAVVCNQASIQGDDLARRVAEAVAPALAPPKWEEKPDPDPKRTETLKAALLALATGRPADAADGLDPAFRSRLATPRGQMGLGGFAPLRDLKDLAFLEERVPDPVAGDRLVRYRARVGEAKRPFNVAFTVTPEGRVFSVGIRPE